MSADGLMAVQHDPFAGDALLARLPLTEAQREVWLACELEPSSSLAFNEVGCLTLEGPLDSAALLDSLQSLVDRHEVLRARFSPDGQWLMVQEQMALGIVVEDISAAPARLLKAAEEQELSHLFDLVQGPLIRWRLLRESSTLHHLSDTSRTTLHELRAVLDVFFKAVKAWRNTSTPMTVLLSSVGVELAGVPRC